MTSCLEKTKNKKKCWKLFSQLSDEQDVESRLIGSLK